MRFLVLPLIFSCAALFADVQMTTKKASAENTEKKGDTVVAFDVSKGFSSVVDKLLPAVVSVQATQVIDQRGDGVMAMPGLPPMGRMGPGNPLEEIIREFMGQMERPRKMQAVGAGFIIKCDGKTALVVTNHHVVSEAKTLTIVLEDKTEIPAKLLASDERNDVAVVSLDLSSLPEEKRHLPTVEWANSDDVKTGDWVIAIGNPFNFGGTVTVGVVSHKGRYVPSGMQQDFEFIQHSAQINVGSSGGALFDINGKVIGINNAIITNTGGNIGIGFAIPSNVARLTVDQLVEFGKTRRGQLGIRIQNFSEDMAESQGLTETGVIVGSVIEGGPSDGKLEVEDIILEYEGKKVTENYILSRMVGATEIGKTITLKVWRKGKIISVKIKVEEMPDSKKDEVKTPDGKVTSSGTLTVAGLEVSKIPEDLKERLRALNKDPKGVIIVRIDPNSPAADQGGLMKGDIIEKVNNKTIETPKDLEAAAKEAKKAKRKNILLFITRDGKPAFVSLRIEDESSQKQKEDDQKSDHQDKQEQKKAEVIVEKTVEEEKNDHHKSEPEQQKTDDEKNHQTHSLKPEVPQATAEMPKIELSHQDESTEHPGGAESNKDNEKPGDSDATIAKDDKNALQSNGSDSLASRIVKKLRSIFGMG